MINAKYQNGAKDYLTYIPIRRFQKYRLSFFFLRVLIVMLAPDPEAYTTLIKTNAWVIINAPPFPKMRSSIRIWCGLWLLSSGSVRQGVVLQSRAMRYEGDLQQTSNCIIRELTMGDKRSVMKMRQEQPN